MVYRKLHLEILNDVLPLRDLYAGGYNIVLFLSMIPSNYSQMLLELYPFQQ